MRIASWNVNSLSVRLNHVLSWLRDKEPDVLCLQELKMQDEKFPYDAFLELGYHAQVFGQKSYNGVAILSRHHQTQSVYKGIPDYQDTQARVLAATYQNVRVINVYVPNGQSVESSKFQYKLDWCLALKKYLQTELVTHQKLVLLGDFNIAPDDHDVHDPKRWQGKVLCTDHERTMLKEWCSLGLYDCFRSLSPDTKAYTWWDYRLAAFERNWGLRIDHLYISKAMLDACLSCEIDEKPRMLERPSDHTPIYGNFTIKV